MSASRLGGAGGGHARRMLALLVPLAAVLVGSACTGGDDLGGEAIARVTAGEMVEVATGGGWVAVGPGDELPSGVRVRTGEADVHIEFASGEFWLGPQGAAEIANDEVELLRGEMLVASKGPIEARWTDVEVTGEGVYRITPGLAPRLGVYSGQARVRRLAEVRTVPALRETSLSSRRLSTAGQPLSYRADDRWDRFLLRDAITFDGEAERLVRGLASQYGTEPRPQQFYAGFTTTPQRAVPPLARTTGSDGSLGPPGEALLRLFLAQSAASDDTPDELDTRVREVVELRTAGARWGLIAAELGVTTQQLADVVDAGQARFATLAPAPEPAPLPEPEPEPEPEPQPEPDRVAATAPPASAQPPIANDPPPPPPPPVPPPASPPVAPETAPAPPVDVEPEQSPPPQAADPPSEPVPDPTGPTGLVGGQPPGGLIQAVLDLLLGLV